MSFKEKARSVVGIPEAGYKKLSGVAQWLVRWSIGTVPYADRLSANLLTIFRIGAALILWLLILFSDWRSRLPLILAINGFSYLTDLFDGAMAQVKNMRSKLGSWLDNSADKLLLFPSLGVKILGISAIFSGLSFFVHLITDIHLFLAKKPGS